jgi:hypothetical protein
MDAVRRRARSLPFFAVLITVLVFVGTWAPPRALQPLPGLDPSWGAGIHMAAERGMHFGSDLVFTHGPLGFLKVPVLWFGGTGAAALLYLVVTRLAFCALLLIALRRSFGWLAAALLAVAIAPMTSDALIPLAFIASVMFVLRKDTSERSTLAFGVAAGLATATELLVKPNTGIIVGALSAVAVLAGSRRPVRATAAFGASLAVAGLALWVIAGERLTDLPDFVHGSLRLISGYSAAMSLDVPGRFWEYGAALVCVVAGFYAAWVTTEAAEQRARLGVLTLWAVLSFLAFKNGFVRHDSHVLLFFGWLAASLPVFAWGTARRANALMTLAVVFVAYLGATGSGVNDLVRPVHYADLFTTEMSDVLNSDDRDRVERQGRQAVREADRLDRTTLRLIGDRTIHVGPNETAVAWAYGLNWRPLPIFQDYAVYTLGLDQQNVDRIESPSAPELMLLRREPGIDGRFFGFDGPATMRSILCNYSEIRRTKFWQLLAHTTDRCGETRLVASVRLPWGRSIGVPAPSGPGRLVYVRIAGTAVQGLERIRSLLFKAHDREILFNRVDRHRLVPGTASDGLILQGSEGVDYRAPFLTIPQVGTVGVRMVDDHQPSGKLRYDFYETTMTAPPDLGPVRLPKRKDTAPDG